MENGGVAAPYHPGQSRSSHSHLAIPGPNDHNGIMNQFQGMSLGGMSMGNGPAPLPMNPSYMLGPDGLVLAPMPASQSMNLAHTTENGYGAFSLNNSYGNPYIGVPVPIMPYTPGRSNAAHPRIDRAHSDVPGLENRRGSYSTTESTPATPFYTGVSHRENGPRVASLDRSAYTTPSPQQIGLTALHVDVPVKPALPTVTDQVLDELIKQCPAIPKAVPAVFTPPGQMKSLEQSLENRIPGNRNVYIRGLHPTTDDELLFKFASRFGAVETSKAIIDTGTGACKGFGFAKFFDVADSEMCIRGFYRLGYEVGFARESFNSRLKAEGDEQSTNLYISNLPKGLTEVELGAIFMGYTILSSKILRDSMGNSRGVGFARFEGRDVCDDIIRKFNGLGIGEEGLLMNIRYADTPSQKELKRVTAERRQFRTNEYNIGAYGTPLVGLNPTLYGSQQQPWRRSSQPGLDLVRNGQPEGAGLSDLRCRPSRNIASSVTAPPAQAASATSASSDGGNGAKSSGSHRGSFQTATSSSAEEAITTPTSSECDKSVTIHADTIVNASLDSSPSVKKETSVKREIQ